MQLRSNPLGKVEVTALQPLVDQLRQAVDGGVVATEQIIEGPRGLDEPEPDEPAGERFDGKAMPVPEAVELEVDANDELLVGGGRVARNLDVEDAQMHGQARWKTRTV